MGPVVLDLAISYVTTVTISSVLALTYLRLPEARLRRASAVWTVVTLSTVGALVWLGTQVLSGYVTGLRDALPRPFHAQWYAFPVMFVFRGVVIMGAWSALFLVVVLSHRVREAKERAMAASALMHQAQLRLLRSQVNPHFLFNALNSVVALIGEEPRKARQMVRDLATLLRRALDSDRNSTANLEREMDFVRLYLRCEKFRFEESLQVHYDVPAETLPMPLPSMLLHPLVENAVKHGRRGPDPLEVHINARLDGVGLVLEVVNSGTIDTDGANAPQGTGTGLRNVRERIAALFPDTGQFELVEERPGWVTARISYTPDREGSACTEH